MLALQLDYVPHTPYSTFCVRNFRNNEEHNLQEVQTSCKIYKSGACPGQRIQLWVVTLALFIYWTHKKPLFKHRSRIECAARARLLSNATIWKFNRTSSTCHVGNFTFLVEANASEMGVTVMRPAHILPAGEYFSISSKLSRISKL